MSAQAFLYVLLAGAAGIAMWILARYAGFGPRSLFWSGVHAVLAFILLRLAPFVMSAIGSGSVAYRYVAVFGVALPMFVYALLSGGWVTRAALGSVRR